MSILTQEKFWDILERSGSTDATRGMERIDFKSPRASLTTFSKTHSYGEYIFDWKWAEAYQRQGLPYYPKLTSMVPFTPATAPHFLGDSSQWSHLLNQHDEVLQKHSSAHFLFTTPEEQLFLGENGYLLRDSFQYHFFNEGHESFDSFLLSLKTKKAKNIRQERLHSNLTIERFTAESLESHHADEMYAFYMMTIREKNAIPYLTQSFFYSLFKELPENTLFVRASDKNNGQLVGGALFYYDKEKIYGRYWGASTFVPNLHFELCYYQGIEFCIEQKIKVFEAGAQGEHKISRGFRPVLTTSAHKFNHLEFSKAIANYIRDEKLQVASAIKELTSWLPFKDF